jgi:hypothetical protein
MRYFQTVFFLLLFLVNYTQANKLPAPCYLLELSSVGFPTMEKANEARRINDLSIFDNKLYLGCGDAVANTGPTDVIYYDFVKKEFVNEFAVDDEAIYTYKIVDNKLMIPGTDATEDWSFGNIYILSDTGWIKHRTIPKGLHVIDLASFSGKLFASTITEADVGEKTKLYFGGVFCSSDTGKTWKLSYATQSDNQNVYHMEDFVIYKNKLYAFPYAHGSLTIEEIPEKYHNTLSEPVEKIYYLLITDDVFGACDVPVYDGKDWRCQDLIPKDRLCRISKPFVFKNMLVMPALFGKYVDYLSSKEKLAPQAETKIFAFDGKKTKSLKFDYDILVDVLIDNETLYLLIKKDDLYYISQTKDLKKWEYYLIPPNVENPKSIQFKDGTFYVGTKDGNIFESIDRKPIKNVQAAMDFVPKKIFGSAELPRNSKWYWIAITDWQNLGKRAQFSAEVKYGNVIKITTENIAQLHVFLPNYYLEPDREIILIINNMVVYEGEIDSARELTCTGHEENGGVVWKVEKGMQNFQDFNYTKRIIGTTEIEMTRQGQDPLVGCWRADAVRQAVAADLAVITRRGIKKDIITSNIYLEDIYDMNYRNTVCTFEITGKQLKKMLEFALQLPEDKWCYISGFKIKYKEKDGKKQIVECTLNPEKKYVVATEDYLAERAKRYFDRNIEYKETDKDVYDALIEWFDKYHVIKDITPRIEKAP